MSYMWGQKSNYSKNNGQEAPKIYTTVGTQTDLLPELSVNNSSVIASNSIVTIQAT